MTGSSAQLRNPELLIALAERIRLFAVGGMFTLGEAQAEIAEMEQWIAERWNHWDWEVAAGEEALDYCLSDEDADCSYEAAALVDARAELQNVEQWRYRVLHATDQYRASVPRFQSMIEDRCHSAAGRLQQRVNLVERYTESPITPVTASMAARPSAGATAAPGPILQRYQVNGSAFADIQLTQIEEPTFEPGELEQADFLDMRQSFDRLPEIRQAIARGTIDRLIARDPAADRVYRWFYGGEAIRLDWQQGHFSITNGKHRVYMARQLGLATLPANAWTP